ncbi:DUF5776 domain-containing protein [Apilactobacillus quenuiae]|uniref:DUF5776 domain-containing protein n=1 Tax=Apilactobacillus quenuiae TaxID=2008377 RepID=UPI000D0156A5|nr:DUF5776 domain-containing protein [Apilactobacillus quenuiae]
MQYNKNKFQKVNDKKVMKKVKKQWVVVSIASLAMLGGIATAYGTTDFVVHADNNDSTLILRKQSKVQSQEKIVPNNQQVGINKSVLPNSDQKSESGNDVVAQNDVEASNNDSSKETTYQKVSKQSHVSTPNKENQISSNSSDDKSAPKVSPKNNKVADNDKGSQVSSNSSDNEIDSKVSPKDNKITGNDKGSQISPSSSDDKSVPKVSPQNNKINDNDVNSLDVNNDQAQSDSENQSTDNQDKGSFSSTQLKKGKSVPSRMADLNSLKASAAQQDNSVAVVNSATEFDNAMNDQKIYTIKVNNDIDLANANGKGYGDSDKSVNVTRNDSTRDFVIDGLKHDGTTWSNIDYRGITYNITGVKSVTLKNQNAYGTSNNGILLNSSSGNGNNQPTYYLDNVHYVGGKIINDTNANVIVNNNVTVNSQGNYQASGISGDTGSHSTDGNSQNMQINTLTVNSGATYSGYTQNANVLDLYNLNVNKGGTLNVTPLGNGNNGKPYIQHGDNTSRAQGIFASSNNGNIQILGNLNINVSSDGATVNTSGTNALYLTGSNDSNAENTVTGGQGTNMYVDGGNVNVNIVGTPAQYPVDIEGALTVENNGNLNIVGKNIGNYNNVLTYVNGAITSTSGGTIYIEADKMTGGIGSNPYILALGKNAGSNLNVTNQGNLILKADGSSDPSLLYAYSPDTSQININNPGHNVILDLDTKHTDPKQKQSNGFLLGNGNKKISLNAYSVSLNNKGPYYLLKIDQNGNITYENANQSTGSLGTIANAKYFQFSSSPSALINDGMQIQKSDEHHYIVSGTIRLNNVPSNDDSQPIYIGISINGKPSLSGTVSKVDNNGNTKQVVLNGQGVVNSSNGNTYGDDNKYTYTINPKYYSNNQIIPFSYIFDASQLNGSSSSNNVSVVVHYYTSGIRSTIADGNSTKKATLNTTLVNPTTADRSVSTVDLPYNTILQQADANPTDALTKTSALNDAIQGQDNSANYKDDALSTYQKVQDAYNLGLKHNGSQADYVLANKNNPDSYQAGQAARLGITDSIQGINPNDDVEYKGWSSTSSQYQAFTNAQKAYQQGLNNPTDSSNSNAKLNETAYVVGVATNQGLADVSIGKNNNSYNASDFNNSGDLQHQAYDNVQKAYQAGINNPTDSSKPDAKLNPTAYLIGQASNYGLSDAKLDRNEDSSDTKYQHSWTQLQQTAYKTSMDGYNAGAYSGLINGSNTSSTKKPAYDQAYSDGFNDKDLINAGLQQALTDFNKKNYTGEYNGTNDISKAAYNSAMQGYKDASLVRTPYTNPNNHAAAYRIANNSAKNDRASGYNDFIFGKLMSTTNNNQAYIQSYQNAQKGYQDAVEGKNASGATAEQQATNEYQAAHNNYSNPKYKNAYNAAYTSFDPQNGQYNNNNHDQNEQDTYNGVADSFDKVIKNNGNKVQPIAADSTHSVDYVLAYNQALNDYQNYDGTQDFINGNSKLSNLSQSNQTIYNKAYNDANRGFQTALDGNNIDSNNQNAQTGFNAANGSKAQDYQQAIKDYYTNPSGNFHGDDIYNATISGIKADNTITFGHLLPFYNAAKDQNDGKNKSLNIVNNINVFNNPNSQPRSLDPRNERNKSYAYIEAYNAVINGYNDGFKNQNNYSGINSDNSYKLSYNSGNKIGANDAGANDFFNGNYNNITELSSYQAQRTSDLAYMQGYNDATDGFNMGVLDSTNYKNNSSYIDGSKEFKDAADQGRLQSSDYNQGLIARTQSKTPNSGDHSNDFDNNASDTYNGIASVISDYKNNLTAKNNSSTSRLDFNNNNSPIFKLAYNEELQNLNVAMNTAQSDFNSGKPSTPGDISASQEQPIYQISYSDYQKGYQEGLSGQQSDGSTQTTNEFAGINAAIKVLNGYQAALNNFNQDHSTNASYTGDNQKAYAEALSGLKDGFAGNNNNQNKTAIYAFANSQQLGIRDALSKINQNTPDINTKDIGLDNVSSINTQAVNTNAYKTAYNSILDGYADGLANNATAKKNNPEDNDKTNYDVGYQQAYQLGRNQAGANDYLADKAPVDESSDYQNGYGQAKSGFSKGISNGNSAKQESAYTTGSKEYQQGVDLGIGSHDNYWVGYNKAQSIYAPTQNDNNEQSLSGNDQKDAYSGFAKAVNDAEASESGDLQQLGDQDTQDSLVFKFAYNNALMGIKNARKQAIDDFNKQQTNSLHPSDQAYVSVYDNVKSTYQNGYQEALNNPNLDTATINKMLPNEQSGYQSAKSLSNGYKDAIDAYYTKGITKVESTDPKYNETGYQEALKGLIDNKTDDRSNISSNLPLYEITRAQSMGTNGGISDAQSKNNDNDYYKLNNPSINAQAYKIAYDAAKTGYQAIDNSGNGYDNSQSNNPVYVNAFNQGAQQRGANDFVKGNSQNVPGNAPFANAYNQGVTTASNAYNGSPTDQSPASQIGTKAAKNKNAGITAAQQISSEVPDSTNADEYNAYWGTKDGYSANDIPLPSSGHNVNVNSQAYKSAKNHAESESRDNLQKGAQQYINNPTHEPNEDGTENQHAIVQGYNNQKAYEDGFNAPDGTNTYQNKGEKDSYKAGQAAASGYNDVQKIASPTTQNGETDSYNGAAQAFIDVHNDQADPTDNSKKSTEYQTSYNKAFNLYKQALQSGSDAYTNDPSAPFSNQYGENNPQATLYSLGNNDAALGYNAVMNKAADDGKNTRAVQAGKKLANTLLDKLNNYLKNPLNNNDEIVKKAIDHAMHDAQVHVGTGTLTRDQITDNNHSAYQEYLDVYHAAYNAYQVGNEVTGAKADAQYANNQAYQAVYKAVDANQQGATDFLNGKQVAQPATSEYTTGYNNAKQGYESALKASVTPDNAYSDTNRGIIVGNDARAGYQGALESENPLIGQYPTSTNYSQASKQAYDGVAAAVIDATKGLDNKQYNPTASHADNYVNAYNEVIDDLFKSAKAGKDDFVNGKSYAPTTTGAMKKAYTTAYQSAQLGFQEGLSGNDINPSNPNEQAGYKLVKDNNLASGYKQAIQDFYKNGVKSIGQIKDTNQAYQDTIKGLIDGEAGNDTNNPKDKSPLYEIARAQSTGVKNGITDAQSKTTTPMPKGLNPFAYNDAYQSTLAGYNAGNAEANYGDQKNNPIYTNSFDQGAQQRGADDFVNGKVNENVPGISPYAQGANDARNSYLNGKAVNGSNAAKAGYNATTNMNSGYENAANGKKPDKNNTVAYNAYWGAQAGANVVQQVPSDVNKNSQAYLSAQQQAQKEAQAGQQQYIADKQKGVTPLEPHGNQLYNQGYNNQKAYDEGLDNPNGNIDFHNDGENAAYQNGIKDGIGYQKAQQSTNPDPNDNLSNLSPNAQKVYKAIAQAFQDVKHGRVQNNDSIDTKYKSTYDNAFALYKSAMNKGSQNFINDPSANINNPYDASNQAAEHGLYSASSSSAKAGYDSVINPHTTESVTDQAAFVAGKNLATNLLNGVKAAISSQKVAPNGDEDGFNAANLAMQNALNDAKGNKNQGQNGKLDVNKIQIPAGINSSAHEAYLNVYKGIYNGYEAGLNGGSNHPTNDTEYTNNIVYQEAYDSAIKKGQEDIPAPSSHANVADNITAPIDFLNNKFMTNFSNPEQQQAYQIAYNDTKVGFYAALNNKLKAVNASNYYDSGYQAGSDGLLGIKAAKNNKLASEKNNKSYMNGYNGYQDGIRFAKSNAKEDRKLSRIYSKDKNVIYNYAYKQAVKAETRRQHNLGVKAGYEAAKRKFTYLPHLNKYSNTYKAAYRKAFDRELSKKMPRYIYNLKAMFKHNSNRFNNSTRAKEYKLVPRDKNHVLRVIGITYSKTGLPRYIIKGGGFVTANSKYVANAYYQHNYDKFKVIRPKGALVHTGKKFSNKNVVRKLHHNEILYVLKVVRYNGITRLYLGKGQYVTSNKTYVDKLHK